MNYIDLIVDCGQAANQWLGKNMSLEALIALPALVLAILVPLAIFMIDKKSTGFAWDKAVILTKVLNARLLFIGLLAMALAPFFWKIDFMRLVVVVLVFIALILLIKGITSSYKWLIVNEVRGQQDNYRTSKRLEYLRSLDDEQKAVIWSLTWNVNRDERALIDDRALVKVFVENLNGIGNKQKSGPGILRDFMANLKSLDLTDPLIHEELVNFTLRWSSSLAHKEKHDKAALNFQMTARRLYFEILRHDLNDSFGSYLLYHDSRNYLKRNGLKEEYFVKYFAVEFFEKISNSTNIDHIWDEFPPEWKISIANLQNTEMRQTALNWLNAYMRWMERRRLLIPKDEKYEYDTVADEVTHHLFPSIEPIMWGYMVAFHCLAFGGYGVEDGETSEHALVRNFLENKSRFGAIGRVYGFWEGDGGNAEERYREKVSQETQETIDLATKTTVFPLFRSESIYKELDNFDFPEDSLEYERLKSLRNIFEAVRKARASE